jgi:hypothetical protein
MSAQARLIVAKRCIIRDANALVDILNSEAGGTRTELIALLLDASAAAAALERVLLVTSVRSDHRDDSALGEHSHANGYCADVWLLRSRIDGDYESGTSEIFALWLSAIRRSPWLYQIGLAGEAATQSNLVMISPRGFIDSGADHVHLGAFEPA